MDSNFISVFICTYNPNHNFLKRTIDGLLSQNLDSSLWSLAIIDNNSSSPVAEIDFVKSLGINVYVEKTQGLTAARGLAEKVAKDGILVFVDDDNVLDNDYLSHVKQTFLDERIGIVSGAIFPEYLKKPDEWFYLFENMLAIRRFTGEELLMVANNYCNDLFPIGAGMSIRKSLIQAYYREHLTNENYIEGRRGNELSSGEDLDLDFYALSKGYKIGLNPKMKMIHIIPENRIKMDYLKKLAVSSLKSSYLVDKKWSAVFGHHVFDTFEMNPSMLRLKIIYNYFFGFVNKRKQLRFVFLKSLLPLLTKK